MRPINEAMFLRDGHHIILIIILSFSEQQTFTGTQNNYCYNYDTLRGSTGLKCLHLNVTTLLPKFDEIKNFIIDLDLDIISLNETRLDKHIHVK